MGHRALIFSVVLLAMIAPASGQEFREDRLSHICLEREDMREQLKSGYGERPVMNGRTGTGGDVEIYMSREGGFTVVHHRNYGCRTPPNCSCVAVSGDSLTVDKNEWIKLTTDPS